MAAAIAKLTKVLLVVKLLHEQNTAKGATLTERTTAATTSTYTVDRV